MELIKQLLPHKKRRLTIQTHAKFIMVLIISIFANVFTANGQDDSSAKALDRFKQAEQEYASRSNDEKKLQSGIYELLKLAEAADTSAAANQELKDRLRIDKSLKADSKDRVRVMVHLKSIVDRIDVIEFLQSSDGVVEETYQDLPYVLCKIHPKKLRALASLTSVITVRRNVEGNTQSIKR